MTIDCHFSHSTSDTVRYIDNIHVAERELFIILHKEAS